MIIVWISFSVFWCPMYNVLYDFVSLCVFLASRLIVPMGAVGACNPILELFGSRVQTDLWLRCTVFLEHCVFVFVELCLCVLHFLITVQSSWVSRACVCGLWRVRWRWDSHEMDVGGCAVRTGGRSGCMGVSGTNWVWRHRRWSYSRWALDRKEWCGICGCVQILQIFWHQVLQLLAFPGQHRSNSRFISVASKFGQCWSFFFTKFQTPFTPVPPKLKRGATSQQQQYGTYQHQQQSASP